MTNFGNIEISIPELSWLRFSPEDKSFSVFFASILPSMELEVEFATSAEWLDIFAFLQAYEKKIS